MCVCVCPTLFSSVDVSLYKVALCILLLPPCIYIYKEEWESKETAVNIFKKREDTKSVFLVVGPLRFNPLYTDGLLVHAAFFSFFYSLIIA